MRKLCFFLIAILWSGIVLFLCLTQSTSLPVITIANLDKYIHAFFHFVFTLLWVLFFRTQINNANKYKPLLVSFVFSVFFGILIEMLQLRLTTTRHADALDVLANIFGAILAVLLVLFYDKIKLQNTNK